MKSRYVQIGLAAVLAVATVGFAQARLGRGGRGGAGFDLYGNRMLEHMSDYLDLTDTQKTQIQSALDAERPHIQSLMSQLANAHQQIMDATHNASFDEAKVRSIANQQTQNITELIVTRARMQSKIYNLLTPEQQAKMDKMRQRHMERMQKWMKNGGPSS